MNRDSDLAEAFQFARAFYTYSGGPRRAVPLAAREALAKARGLIAALPALEEQEAAARAALEEVKARDGRRYAPGMKEATAALAKARAALQSGRAWKYAGPIWRRGYCGTWQPGKPGLFYVEDAKGLFRNVEKASEVGGRYNRVGIPEGYYCDPYQESLCVAFVVQLPSRKGRARFAAAYQLEESDNGRMTVDLSRTFEGPAGDFDQENTGARKEAARAADQLAEKAAESEREYQTAWWAGSRWADLKAEEEEARAEALAILKERRKARGLDPSGFPALCAALRGQVAALCRQIAKSRKARAKLAEGDAEELYFWNGEERLRAAFCEAAGLESFPA